MRLDLKNTGQIFEGTEARFFINKLVSFTLLRMDICKDVVRTCMDYLFPIRNEKNVFSSQHCKGVAHSFESLSNFIAPTEEYLQIIYSNLCC